jgi:hypothetical protein
MGFGDAIQLAGHRWPRLSLQRRVPLADELLADPHDLALAEADGRGDLMVGSSAVGMALVGEQQDTGSPREGGGDGLSPADGLELLALIRGKDDAHLEGEIWHPCVLNQEKSDKPECKWSTISRLFRLDGLLGSVSK